jgi:DMSO/TMAO reductase YedYZ heme-binding membrane subunit
MKIKPLFTVLAALVLVASASALPNSDTSVSGANCQMGHTFTYSYSIVAPKSSEAGDAFTVTIEFKLKGDSKLARAPRKVSATLSGLGIETIGDAKQEVSAKASWQVRAAKAGTAKMSFATEFFIDGRDFHSSYTATYRDSIDFSVVIKSPPAPPVGNGGQNQTPANETVGHANQTNATGAANNLTAQNGTGAQGTGMPGNLTDNGTQEITQEFEGEIPAEPDQLSWLLTRSVGLIAYLFLFLSVLTALLKKARYAPRFTLLFKYHHDISLLSLVLALFHGLSNILDQYMWNLSLDKVFIPQFGSNNQNLIALGVIAFYFMLIVVATSVGSSTIKRMGFRRWKYVHMTSYIAFVFVFLHSIILGTDVKSGGPIAYLVWFSGFLMALISIDLIMQRVFSGKKSEPPL